MYIWRYFGYIVEKQENVVVFFSICRGLFVQCLSARHYFFLHIFLDCTLLYVHNDSVMRLCLCNPWSEQPGSVLTED